MRPADVEGALLDYLSQLLDVPVDTHVPSPRPAAFVRLYRIGGVRLNMAQERSLLNVEAWGANETAAYDLAARVWGLLDDADGEFLAPGVWLADGSSGLASPVSNPDPDSGQARYQFTANVTINLQESA